MRTRNLPGEPADIPLRMAMPHDNRGAGTAAGTGRTVEIVLPRERRAARTARAEFDRMRDAFPPGRFEDARLLVSELVTNAVRHGEGGSVRVVTRLERGSAHVEVVDEGAGFAATSVAAGRDRTDLDREGGWGLPLVEELADDWGSFAGSTHVWFRLDARADR